MEDQNNFFDREHFSMDDMKTPDNNFMKAVSKFENFYKSLYPDFNELSVFLIGFVLFLLILFNPECRNEFLELYKPIGSSSIAPSIIRVCFIFGASLAVIFGFMASFAHILIFAEKDSLSIFCMKTFALIILGYTGIKSGFYVQENQNYLLIISPAWNLILGAICFSGLGMIDEVPFDQTESKYTQTVLSVILVSIIFYFLNFVLELYWPIILSISVNYVVCINKGTINSKFLKLYSIQR